MDCSYKVALTNKTVITARCLVHLSSNAVLVNHFFSSKEALQSFTTKLKPVREQIIAMGAKIDGYDGEVFNFKVAGDVTLDMLMNGMKTE